MNSIGLASACGLLFIAVGVGFTAKPLHRSCPDGSLPEKGKCYYVYDDYQTDYNYYEEAVPDEQSVDSK
jgi:hypothetical protein